MKEPNNVRPIFYGTLTVALAIIVVAAVKCADPSTTGLPGFNHE